MKLFGGIKSIRSTNKTKSSALADFFNKKWVRVFTIILAVIGTVVIGGVTWWKMNVKPPEIPEIDVPDHSELPVFDINTSPKPVDSDNPHPTPVNNRKQGVYTFLFLGRENDGNTDTIMVGMLDTANETFNIVSIPRDTMVNVKRTFKKINAAYAMGESSGKGNGVLQMKSELKTVLGFVPDFYVIVNYRGFTKLVDTMGGVDFYVPANMYKVTDDMTINLQKGQKKLSGNQALQLVRYRGYTGSEGVGNDDYGRMTVQQNFLKAMAKQALSLGNLFKLNEYLDIAQENLDTDLSGTTMLWIAEKVMGYGMDCLNFYTLPTESAKYNGTWYEHVKVDEAVELINQTINPYVKDITIEDLDILKLKS